MAAARGAELDPATAAVLRQLRAANRRQAQELDILKKSQRQRLLYAQSFTDTGPMSRCRFIAAQRDQYPVRLLCQLVEVLASSYSAWQQVQQQAVT